MRYRLLWLVVLGCLFIPTFPDPPLYSGPFVQHVTPDSAVIAKIDPSPRALSLRVAGSDGEAVCERPLSEPRRRHAFEVDGLEAGRTYSYALLDADGDAVGEGEFSTPPADDRSPVRFAVVGDSGGLPWWNALQRGPLFYAVARYDLLGARATNSGIGRYMAAFEPHLWFHVGDVIYPSGEHRHYRLGFFRPFGELIRNSPGYVAIGNHDLRNDLGRQLFANFDMPENTITGDERFFVVSWGSVRFVCLDLPWFMYEGHPAGRYLDQAFEGATEPWRIVMAHYPIYSAGRHKDRPDLIKQILPRLQRNHVDVMFSGHDHNYQRFAPHVANNNKMVFVVTGGGGKVLYDVERHPMAAVAESIYHFCRATVAGPVLTLEGVDVDGVVFDRYEMNLAGQKAARNDFDPETSPRDGRIEALLR